MPESLVFFVNGKKVTEPSPDPEWTLLQYLRNKLRLTGSKLACGEGGCGACTVMVSKFHSATNTVSHLSVNACLAPVCSMHGLAVTTVEGIGSTARLHPVQARIAEAHGSQCGFCTPGMVMSMYTLLRNTPSPTSHDIDAAFDGNLCRCTGYRPILQGFYAFAKDSPCGLGENCCRNTGGKQNDGALEHGCKHKEALIKGEASGDAPVYDPTQDIIFPPELKLDHTKYHGSTVTFKGERATWTRPTTLDELLILKKDHPDVKFVVGNTEIGIETKFKGFEYPIRVAPTHVPELTAVQREAGGIRVGAAVTLATLDATLKQAIAELPEHQTRMYVEMVEMLKWFAGNQIRNVACIGGNIMTASPISDLNPLLLAASASLELRAAGGARREVVMDDKFFLGYRKTLVQPQELLVSVLLPFTGKDEYFGGFKQANRKEDDISIVNAGMRVHFESGSDVISDLHLAYGGMAPVTVMATGTMASLKGLRWDEAMVQRACECLESDLPLDPSAPGGTVDFRRTLTTSFFFRFFLAVRLRLHGDEAVSARERSGATPLTRPPLQASQLYSRQVTSPDDQQPPAGGAVGRPLVHVAAFKQATGEAVYVDDMPRLEGELYAEFVQSSKAHARLVNVDVSRALAMPGVRGYVGHDDIPGQTWWHSPEEVSMAKDVVTCQGQIIGCIVADSKENAQRAVREVKVTYEELEAIITIEEAIAKGSYHSEPMVIRDGDPDSNLRASQHVLEGQLHLGAQEHFYFETHAAIIVPKEDGEMEMFVSTQNPTETQNMVAAALGVPANRVVCRTKRMGGGFGGKETRGVMYTVPAAVAARKYGVPVRFALDRNVDMASSGTRHPFLGRYKVGFSGDGKIVATDIQLYSNCGSTRDLSRAVMERALLHSDSSYKIPHFRVAGYPCKTNIPSNTAFRGFGGPQGLMIAEHLVERVAEALNLPPEKVRERNFYKDGDATHFGQQIVDSTLDKCWAECISQSDFPSRRTAADDFNRENRWKKRGIALAPLKFGISYTLQFLNQGGALVMVYLDGSVLLTHGGTEMGQGLHTKMIQVASQALGVPTSRIYISETSTATVPNTSPTAASMSSDLNGMAVLNACQTICKRLEPVKAANPKGSWEDWIKEAYMQRISLSTTGFYKVPGITPIDYKVGGKGSPFNYFSYGAACTEVEVDCLTGDHQVLRTDIVMDVGNSLNPAVDIGQIEGGFMQGYGLVALEEYKVTPQGTLLTQGPGSYKIPSALNIPAVFNVTLLKDSPNTRAVYSSKAVGEPPLLLASSVYLALRDGVRSARADAGLDLTSLVLDCPTTPPRLRMACQDRFTKQFPPAEKGTYTPWFVDL